ncbi:hypothetical protein [Arthrobacter sp. H14-L1]|uniref:hypothetical protein n=1 Tax=Arthrobacter sp. H14-L1 TaxID=2996697 RepID=UPI0022714D64|nr:hypothetical protein [Arthrobacter sp. H14-L1]MCY0904022.1 hypothetical protein [Arthrobacter sp. H14-L1]
MDNFEDDDGGLSTCVAAGSSKIGLIVPSTTTLGTELPQLFRRQSAATGHRYTFHSARAKLRNVTVEELAAMVDKAAECAHRVAMVAPYMPVRTRLVNDSIEGAGVAVQKVEDELGLPVVTAATASAYEILRTLGLEPAMAGAGRVLADRSTVDASASLA